MYKISFKKALCTVLACSMAGSLVCLPAHAEEFTDIEGHWAQRVIEKWNEKGIVKGYDGKFRPDDFIIRGDMAVVLNRLKNYSGKSQNEFLDLEEEAYFADAVLKLNKEGVMLGADGLVRPRDFITREEAFVMINRIYKFTGTSQSTGFEDEGDVSDWAKKDILAMCENKIINGSNGKINPKHYITRAEIMQILENILAYFDKTGTGGSGNNDEELETGTNNNPGGSITIGGGGNKKPSSGGSSGSSGDTDEDTEESGSAIGADDLEAGGIW